MNKLVKSHRDLKVYQLSFEAGMQIFELSKKFPDDKYDHIISMLVKMENNPEDWAF